MLKIKKKTLNSTSYIEQAMGSKTTAKCCKCTMIGNNSPKSKNLEAQVNVIQCIERTTCDQKGKRLILKASKCFLQIQLKQ